MDIDEAETEDDSTSQDHDVPSADSPCDYKNILMVFQVNEVIVGRIVRPIEISIQTRQWQNCALRYMKQQAFSVMPPTMWTILIALRKRWRL